MILDKAHYGTKKKTEYSEDSRSLIINHHLNGHSLSEIAKYINISRIMVQYIVKKDKMYKCVKKIPSRERKRTMTQKVAEFIRRTLIS